MSPAELRSVELREALRGADPGEVEAAIERWAGVLERGGRLDRGTSLAPHSGSGSGATTTKTSPT